MNTAIRAKGTALTSMSCWIANFFIVGAAPSLVLRSFLTSFDIPQAQITPRAIKAIGWRYYICFAVMSATNALTIYLFFPESKNIPLECLCSKRVHR